MKPATFYILIFMVWMVVTVAGIAAFSFVLYTVVLTGGAFDLPGPVIVTLWFVSLMVAPVMVARAFFAHETRVMGRGESWRYAFAFTAAALIVTAAEIALAAALTPALAEEFVWAWENASPVPEIAIALLTLMIFGMTKLLLWGALRSQSARAARKR